MVERISTSAIPTKPVAVLFDVDDTLYDYASAKSAADKVLEEQVESFLGVPASLCRSMFSQARQDVKDRLEETASGHNRLLYIQRMIEMMGFKSKPLLSLYLEEMYWRAYFQNAVLFSGVIDTLEWLKESNILVGIVSDLTARLQLRKLVYFGLESYFDAIVTSEETGVDKPDKRNFDLALSKLGLGKESGQIWMVGDDPSSDMVGGQTINAVTFQKVHRDIDVGQDEAAPDFLIREFDELYDFILDCAG
ncbi:haloacid dehalogenase-like hydrolase, putative [Synechococcus sp. PCC 7335]|uniref:HAD family hydrolase n=1 Tax=Synechococcus sp. (strain ATCC 29403 / PCC 7335) TaxID=91464 RepID=UPI00017EC0A3|nr:HAD family hydrolase [Synechococcus sp. PCC 7335]EDX83453.1 haloacid dehalogenase-like hydrolase, putative [Synechococcus sp. PCC 7335]